MIPRRYERTWTRISDEWCRACFTGVGRNMDGICELCNERVKADATPPGRFGKPNHPKWVEGFSDTKHPYNSLAAPGPSKQQMEARRKRPMPSLSSGYGALARRVFKD